MYAELRSEKHLSIEWVISANSLSFERLEGRAPLLDEV